MMAMIPYKRHFIIRYLLENTTHPLRPRSDRAIAIAIVVTCGGSVANAKTIAIIASNADRHIAIAVAIANIASFLVMKQSSSFGEDSKRKTIASVANVIGRQGR